MKICVVGAGAMGGTIAFQLARTGHEVSVVARGQHLAAICERGLTLVNHAEGGVRATIRLRASDDPTTLAAEVGPQDVVVIGLKAHAIPAMLPRLAPLLGAQSILLPAINGLPWWYFCRELGPHDGAIIRSVDPDGAMVSLVNASQIIGCVVHLAGEVREPGIVHFTGGAKLVLGEIDRGLANPLTIRLGNLTEALNHAGFQAVASPDIRHDVWSKLIGNLSFNPVAALSGLLMDAICAHEGLLDIIRPMIAEGMAVAAKFGVVIPMTPDQRVDVARQLGRAKISMHQDFEAGRRPEIDAIVGAVVEVAGWVGIDVPTVRIVEALVRARAAGLGLLGAP